MASQSCSAGRRCEYRVQGWQRDALATIYYDVSDNLNIFMLPNANRLRVQLEVSTRNGKFKAVEVVSLAEDALNVVVDSSHDNAFDEWQILVAPRIEATTKYSYQTSSPQPAENINRRCA